MTTYLNKIFCKKILERSLATAVKLLCQLDELKKNTGNEYRITIIQKKLVYINNIIETINYYTNL